jgi:hypothetical protein
MQAFRPVIEGIYDMRIRGWQKDDKSVRFARDWVNTAIL